MNNRIFIVAHAPLAQALKACVMHVYPECAHEVLALDVQADDTPEQSLEAAQQLWAGVPDGDVLVLTDVLGATPANVALQWARGRKTKVLAGVNLPMLLRSAFACAPPGAHIEVLAVAHHVTRAAAGQGALREFCDVLLMAKGDYARQLRIWSQV